MRFHVTFQIKGAVADVIAPWVQAGIGIPGLGQYIQSDGCEGNGVSQVRLTLSALVVVSSTE